MKNTPFLKKYKNAMFFTGASILLYWLYYVLLDSIYKTHIIIIDIVGQLASALLLAGLLTISVERLNILNSKELYQNEISKLSLGFLNLFAKDNDKTLHIEDKDFSKIMLDIAGNSHYRKNYKVTFDEVTNDGYIIFYVKYEIINLLNSDQERHFSLYHDPKIEDITLNELVIQSGRGEILHKSNNIKQIKSITKKNGSNIKITTNYVLPAKESVKIQFTMKQKLKHSTEKGFHFNSIWITKNIIVKVKNKIEKKYKIEFTNFHNLKSIDKDNDSGYSVYKFCGFMLPYQGFQAKLISKKNKK